MERNRLTVLTTLALLVAAAGCGSGGEGSTSGPPSDTGAMGSSDTSTTAGGDTSATAGGDTSTTAGGDTSTTSSGDTGTTSSGDIGTTSSGDTGGDSNSWSATNPLLGMTFWVDPRSRAAQEIARQTANPDAVAALEKIATRSNAHWFGDWVSTDKVAAQVSAVVSSAEADSSVPILPLYAIPYRDCGSFSAGGFTTAAAYGAWIAQVAAGIGTRRAIVILEPDALGVVDCLSDTQLSERLTMIRDAVATLRKQAPGAIVYVATVSWIPVATSAERLQLAGVERARGFAINTADFKTTDSQLAYGESLSAALGGAAYVVDTSRNGLGPYSGTLAWCNPPGRALGPEPSTDTGSPHADAFLWIKTIGASDGTCNRGEPSAGTWWPEYAIGLAERAAF